MSEAALDAPWTTLPAMPADPYAAAATGALAVLDDTDPGTGGGVHLEDLVERWVLTYGAHTRAGYRANLAEWLAYCRGRGQDPLTVSADVVRDYQAQLDASDLTPVTVRVKLAAVRSFYRYVVEDRVLDHDPAAGTTRRAPASLAASLALAGQDRSLVQLAAGFLLSHTGHTRRAYDTALRLWFTWCREVAVDPLQAQRAHVDAFRAVLDERYKPNSVNQRMVIVRSFYRYCVEEGVLATSPARAVKMHRLPNVSTSTGLDREEARTLLRAVRHDPLYSALFTLLLLNGLRISEALGTDVEHLSSVRGHRVLMVERKGTHGSRQAVPLAPRTLEALDAWLEVRPARLAPGYGWTATSGPLFVNQSGVRMARGSAWSAMRTVAKRVLPEKAATLHPHDLRNAYVTLSLDAGVPLRDVQDSAGHSSADTTRRYDTGRNNLDRNATYTLTRFLAGE